MRPRATPSNIILSILCVVALQELFGYVFLETDYDYDAQEAYQVSRSLRAVRRRYGSHAGRERLRARKARLLHQDETASFADGRQLNILTLGGSVTWGAMLDNRSDAYPFRLRDHYGHKVTNLALRGTGSGYPAQCISTMLGGESKKSPEYDPEVPFDVIILEFSLNGTDGIQLLVQRLRERFPDAFFIYVDVFSLSSPNGAVDSKVARKLVLENGGEIYNFGNTGVANAHYNFREEIEDHDNPTEEIRAMFGNDRHHPSATGHDLITSKVMEIIDQHDFPSKPRLGSWLGGDACFSWYEDGEPTLKIIDGGKIHHYHSSHKWSIQVSYKDGAIIEYNHKSDKDASFSLQYMTKSSVRGDPNSSKYPPVIISIEQNFSDIEARKTAALLSEVELNRENVNKINKIGEGWTYLSGLHRKPSMSTFHITEVSRVGTLKPGRNFIYIYPVEERIYPFRLTATIICEACERLGWVEDLSL